MNLRKSFVHPQFGCIWYVVLVKFRMDGKERVWYCETKMMREATWAWAKAMPPLRRVRYLKQNIVSFKDGKHWWRIKFILLVLSPCPEVPLASSPGPIEGHHRDHLQVEHHDTFQFSKLGLFNSGLGLCQCGPRWQWCRHRQGTCRPMSRKPRCGTQCSRCDSHI